MLRAAALAALSLLAALVVGLRRRRRRRRRRPGLAPSRPTRCSTVEASCGRRATRATTRSTAPARSWHRRPAGRSRRWSTRRSPRTRGRRSTTTRTSSRGSASAPACGSARGSTPQGDRVASAIIGIDRQGRGAGRVPQALRAATKLTQALLQGRRLPGRRGRRRAGSSTTSCVVGTEAGVQAHGRRGRRATRSPTPTATRASAKLDDDRLGALLRRPQGAASSRAAGQPRDARSSSSSSRGCSRSTSSAAGRARSRPTASGWRST